MVNNKRFLCLGMIVILALSLSACGNKKSVSYDPLPEDNDTVYSIHICQDEDNAYYNAITLGFSDALTDLFGESHVRLTSAVATSESPVDSIIAEYLSDDTQMLFANGTKSLSAAAEATETTPVVGAGVMDFQSTLHLMGYSNDDWNQKTGTNVTGVSSLPDMDAMLSLLIESTPDLRSVGILYPLDDPAALYQNKILETYLDQAGIPWKEYPLPSESEVSDVEETISDSTVITPSKRIAPSATEGPNMDVESIGGNNLISGIIAPESIHTPSSSIFWTEELSAANPNPLDKDADLDEIISYACRECSCLFLPSGSNLADATEEISEIAVAAGVVTVGGDASIGSHTLTSLYSDPYTMGYQAGKMAYRILIADELPGEIKIASSSAKNVKLYNRKIAEMQDRIFPKSFREINDFLETYEVGSDTNRISETEDDEE